MRACSNHLMCVNPRAGRLAPGGCGARPASPLSCTGGGAADLRSLIPSLAIPLPLALALPLHRPSEHPGSLLSSPHAAVTPKRLMDIPVTGAPKMLSLSPLIRTNVFKVFHSRRAQAAGGLPTCSPSCPSSCSWASCTWGARTPRTASTPWRRRWRAT